PPPSPSTPTNPTRWRPRPRRSRREEGEEEGQEERGDLQNLHLQGPEAGAPRHRHLLQGHVHHELLHQRHIREARRRGRQARAVQQEAHHHLPRDPDLRAPRPPRRARQTCRLRGNQGRHQVHQQLSSLQRPRIC
ncbi:Histone H2B, partial [Zea mays]